MCIVLSENTVNIQFTFESGRGQKYFQYYYTLYYKICRNFLDKVYLWNNYKGSKKVIQIV